MTRDVTLTLAVDTGPLVDQIASLQAEIEALQADRDRLDYLGEGSTGSIRLYGEGFFLPWGPNMTHKTLRAAIDARKGGAA